MVEEKFEMTELGSVSKKNIFGMYLMQMDFAEDINKRMQEFLEKNEGKRIKLTQTIEVV